MGILFKDSARTAQ